MLLPLQNHFPAGDRIKPICLLLCKRKWWVQFSSISSVDRHRDWKDRALPAISQLCFLVGHNFHVFMFLRNTCHMYLFLLFLKYTSLHGTALCLESELCASSQVFTQRWGWPLKAASRTAIHRTAHTPHSPCIICNESEPQKWALVNRGEVSSCCSGWWLPSSHIGWCKYQASSWNWHS